MTLTAFEACWPGILLSYFLNFLLPLGIMMLRGGETAEVKLRMQELEGPKVQILTVPQTHEKPFHFSVYLPSTVGEPASSEAGTW